MLEANPLISVIIPTFNRSSTIERAIKSVLNQTYKNLEIIVIDDGSTDNTENLLQNNPQVKYIKQTNAGVSAARNKGIKYSEAEWIAFLDSDDEWLPEKLYLQMKLLQETPDFQCVYGEEIWIRNNVRVNQMTKHKKGGGDQFLQSVKLCIIAPSSVLLKKSIFESIGTFREDYPVCEDYDLWLKLTSLYDIGFVEGPIINKYGGHPDQLSTKFVAMDYYRIKSIDWILRNRELTKDKREEAIKVLTKKASILIKGYRKHNNLENLPEIEKIRNRY